MKKKPKKNDPLGKMPDPITGFTQPLYLDDDRREASEAATAAFKTIWIKNDRQDAIVAQLRKFVNDWKNSPDRMSVGGRRLSQESQAGKSATMKRLRALLAEFSARQGSTPNKYQVIIVLLKKRTTLKGLYQQILKAMGDPHWEQNVPAATLLKRIEEHSVRIGVELVVIDEVQHLDNKTNDAETVLDQLKVFVDEAYFPVVFVGDEESEPFFERNWKLAARLGEPLLLLPLDPLGDDADAVAFKRFCERFDRALVRTKAITGRSGLGGPKFLDGLILASGGHVGRVARILEVAVPFSVWRGAERIEGYDLSHAVRTYAMKNRWVDHDPFSTLEA